MRSINHNIFNYLEFEGFRVSQIKLKDHFRQVVKMVNLAFGRDCNVIEFDNIKKSKLSGVSK